MSKKTIPPKVSKVYIVISENENKFCASFLEAETYAKDLCEVNEEEIQIFEITKAWSVYFPEEPEPEINNTELDELIG